MLAQIYEIQTPEQAAKCIELGVDRIGSVLVSALEWKNPAIQEVIGLSKGTAVLNSLIPLFSDWDTLCRAMDYYRPPIVHFCENLTDADGRSIDLDPLIRDQQRFKDAFPEIAIMRSIPLPVAGEAPDFPYADLISSLEPTSDFFLIDTWLAEEPVRGFVGITGKQADPERAKDLVLQTALPVILAGGLSPENVYEALYQVMPAGADSCTHTNRLDASGNIIRFKKDFEKVERFVKEIRRVEGALRSKRKDLKLTLAGLAQELQERVASLPKHSVRPHQIMAIEDLEEQISLLEKQVRHMDRILQTPA